MLERGMEITAVEYINAHKMRKEIRTAFLKAMKEYDALLVPTTIISAPKLDQTTVNINEKNAMEVYQALSRLTTVFDITGLPAMNVPAGFIEDEKKKLPIGVQLVGNLSMKKCYLESHIIMMSITESLKRRSLH